MSSSSPADRPAPHIDNLRGASWMLGSVLAASVMTIGVRDLAEEMDTRMLVLLRSVMTVAAVLLAMALSGRVRRGIRFTRPWQHLIRGLLVGVSIQLGFFTIANLPLATATALFFTAPIFATVLAIPFHGEKVGPRRWMAIGAGFLGALIVLRPGSGIEPAMLTGLGSSLTLALALAMSRRLAQADGALSALTSSLVITAVISVPVAWPVLSLPSDGWAWGLLVMTVASGAIRAFADIEAYRHGEAGLIAPLTYLRLVTMGLAGYLLYAELPDAATWAGSAVIILSSLYIARRETRLRRR